MGPSGKKRRPPIKKSAAPAAKVKRIKESIAGDDDHQDEVYESGSGALSAGGRGGSSAGSRGGSSAGVGGSSSKQQTQQGWFRQKFREEWCAEPAFKGWLEQVPDDPFHCWCRVCECGLMVGRSELLKHGQTKKHKWAMEEEKPASTANDADDTANLMKILAESGGGGCNSPETADADTGNANATAVAENGEKSVIDRLVEAGKVVKLLETTPTGEVRTSFSTISGRAVNAKSAKQQLKPVDDVLMSVELRLAAFAVEHNLSGTAVEHLGDLIVQRPDVASKIRMTKRKCAALVKNVLAKSIHQCLDESLQKTHFSLIVDDSIVQGSPRVVNLFVRYYDDAKNRVRQGLLESFIVTDTEASINNAAIHETIASIFRRRNIPLENILGVAADRVSVIYRDLELLKKSLFCENDGAVVLSCNHRSMTEVCMFAVGQAMPSSLQRIARYLGPSALVLEQNAHMQELEGGGDNDHQVPREAINCGWDATRWLVEPVCVHLLLRHMDSMKEQLAKDIASLKSPVDEALYKELIDPYTKAHLMFLSYILTPFKVIEDLFRSEEVVLHRLQNECRVQFRVVCQHFLTPSAYMLGDLATVDPYSEANLLPVKDVFVGLNCQMELQDLSPETNEVFLMQCRKFLQVAASELQSRIPLTGELLDGLAFLDPDVALKEEGRTSMPTLDIELANRVTGFDVVKLTEQWQSLLFFFPEDDLKALRKLPVEVMWGVIGGVHTTDNDEPDFGQLARLAKMALSLPLTNRDIANLSEMSVELQRRRCYPRQSKETVIRTLDTIVPVRHSLKLDSTDCRTMRLNDKHRKFYRIGFNRKGEFDDDPHLFVEDN